MIDNKIESILALYHGELRKSVGDILEKLLLFGSYARGDYDSESDIDIMILLDVEQMN